MYAGGEQSGMKRSTLMRVSAVAWCVAGVWFVAAGAMGQGAGSRETLKGASIRIVNPTPGAAAWGTIGVGVEFEDWRPAAGGVAGGVDDVVLLASDGREFRPVSITGVDRGPVRHALFEVTLMPEADQAAGAGAAAVLTLRAARVRSGGRAVQSEPVSVHVLQDEPAATQTGEAEGRYDVERPKRFPGGRRTVSNDASASGGKYLNNAGAYPALCFPVRAESAGMYQVVLRARGDLAGTAYPTVGVYRNDADQPVTNGRVTADRWERFTIGVPFRLEAGEHVITTFFENDFYVEGMADRNLAIDTFEVRRLPDGMAMRGASEGGAGMMMKGGAGDVGGGEVMSGAMTEQMNPTGMMMTDAGESMMMSSGRSGVRGRAGSSEAAMGPAGLRVAFTRRLDGQPVAGELEVEGMCWWGGGGGGRMSVAPPRVTLMVNDLAIGVQRTGAPRFVIDPRAWKPGENTVRMIARMDHGMTASTAAMRVMWTPSGAIEPYTKASTTEADENAAAYLRKFERYTIHDERWEPAIRSMMSTDRYPSEQMAAAMASNASVSYALPEGLAGEFEVQVESFGEEFRGAPILKGTLTSEAGTTTIGETTVQGWWGSRTLGRVRLSEGDNRIAIAFTNDLYEAGKGDRNVWFQALVLREVRGEKDTKPPVARVVYPTSGAAGHDVYMQDAIVADVADDVGVARVELLIDGKGVGSYERGRRTGRVVMPLLARGLSAGTHTAAVRVTDEDGNIGESAPVTINVLGSEPAGLLRYERAVRMLNVFAYGPDDGELAAILTMGEEAWLRDRLGSGLESAGEVNALTLPMIRFANDRSEYDVPRRALMHAMLTPNPARARFVLWAQNHFSTWIRKTEADRKWEEHAAFARAGVGRFAELLLLSAMSPAMLRYLDQERSYAGRLNENYAREIMELHTMGVDGGYTQSDVTSLARVLTGWMTARQGDGRSGGEMRADEFRFDPALSDGGSVRLLGTELGAAEPGARYERAHAALDVLATHPSTARYIATKLAEHYGYVPAPAGMVDALERRFVETGGDLREVLMTLAGRAELFERGGVERLAHPIGFALRLGRTTGHVNPWGVGDYLQRSGVGLFDRSTPDGYPEEDSAYTDSNAMLQRWRFVQEMWWQLVDVLPGEMRWGDLPEREEETLEWAQRVIDTLAVEVTGRVLSAESNEAAMKVVREGAGPKQERLQTLMPFVAQLPEFSLR